MKEYEVLVEGSIFKDSDAHHWKPGDIVTRKVSGMFLRNGDVEYAPVIITSDECEQNLRPYRNRDKDKILALQNESMFLLIDNVNKKLDKYRLMQPIFCNNNIFYAVLELNEDSIKSL